MAQVNIYLPDRFLRKLKRIDARPSKLLQDAIRDYDPDEEDDDDPIRTRLRRRVERLQSKLARIGLICKSEE